ncbi:MAG: 3-isopropylmalate dehydrogenase [Spirochaetaceae bacterium]|jgi:3-isopropylmalate dehydrogenase|nr:3-isopropylmalate dehydrogenase [Spirochaetaceae bacterium]
MGEYRIALIPGDGIGPEVAAPAIDVLNAVGKKFGHGFTFTALAAGGAAIDRYGEPLPSGVLEAAKDCGALLLGAVGGPKWDTLPGDKRPERALLALRKGLGVFANLRPAALLPQLRDACPLKEAVLAPAPPVNSTAGRANSPPAKDPPQGTAGAAAGFDLLIVRELTGGLYFGDRGRSAGGDSAFDTERYSRREIERVLRVGFEAALRRRRKVTVVDKANVLETSRLWREVAQDTMKDYPGVATDFLYVDNAAMQLISCPGQFDVIITSNLFGDILSDEASVLTGSIGMLPSASLGAPSGKSTAVPAEDSGALPADTGMISGATERFGMYEPIHGSAPDIAGKDMANPLGMILSAAMMLRYSFGLEGEALAVEGAVRAVLDRGLRTPDIARWSGRAGQNRGAVGTREMGAAVVKALEEDADAAGSSAPQTLSPHG